jgi:curved DNA-binding protein CbpA
MATTRDYYDILEVDRGASPEEIKRSFRNLAMKYHPDRNPGDAAAETSFKEVNEAYEVLSDPNKRSQYDTFGRLGGMGSGGFADTFAGAGFGDIFDMFFGGQAGGRTRTSPWRRPSLRAAADIRRGGFRRHQGHRGAPPRHMHHVQRERGRSWHIPSALSRVRGGGPGATSVAIDIRPGGQRRHLPAMWRGR